MPEILALVQRIRRECPPEKDIWMWTGYKLDELNDAQREVIEHINVLVDGKFVQDLHDPMLIWRGSSNRSFTICADTRAEPRPVQFLSEPQRIIHHLYLIQPQPRNGVLAAIATGKRRQ